MKQVPFRPDLEKSGKPAAQGCPHVCFDTESQKLGLSQNNGRIRSNIPAKNSPSPQLQACQSTRESTSECLERWCVCSFQRRKKAFPVDEPTYRGARGECSKIDASGLHAQDSQRGWCTSRWVMTIAGCWVLF